MSSNLWDEFASGEFVEFENPGDTITGTIAGIAVHEYDGKKYPQLALDTDGEPRTLTAWNVELIKKLRELRPVVGDTLTVTYTGTEKIQGGRTMKKFTVTAAAPAAEDKAPF